MNCSSNPGLILPQSEFLHLKNWDMMVYKLEEFEIFCIIFVKLYRFNKKADIVQGAS